jgi:hypothetical protein
MDRQVNGFGERFCLKAPKTWGVPDDVADTPFTSQRKVTYRIEIQARHNLLMRGKKILLCTNIPLAW